MGRTPLHRAALWGSFECVKLLLEQRSDPLVQDDYGDTPIDFACEIDHLEIASLLLNAAKHRIMLTKKSQLLYRAVEKGLNDMADLILSHHADILYCSSAGVRLRTHSLALSFGIINVPSSS